MVDSVLEQCHEQSRWWAQDQEVHEELYDQSGWPETELSVSVRTKAGGIITDHLAVQVSLDDFDPHSIYDSRGEEMCIGRFHSDVRRMLYDVYRTTHVYYTGMMQSQPLFTVDVRRQDRPDQTGNVISAMRNGIEIHVLSRVCAADKQPVFTQ